MAETQDRGRVCPACARPDAVIVRRECRTLVLLCPVCGRQWNADAQEAPAR